MGYKKIYKKKAHFCNKISDNQNFVALILVSLNEVTAIFEDKLSQQKAGEFFQKKVEVENIEMENQENQAFSKIRFDQRRMVRKQEKPR